MPLMWDCGKLDELSFWPEAGPVDNTDIGLAKPDGKPFECAIELGPEWTRRTWRLDLCRDGTVSLRRRDEEAFNGVALPVAYSRSKRDLQTAQAALCRLDRENPDSRLIYEEGRRYLWCGWLPGTTWQLSAVSRVLHLHLTGEFQRSVKEAVRLSKLVEDAAARDGLRLARPEDTR